MVDALLILAASAGVAWWNRRAGGTAVALGAGCAALALGVELAELGWPAVVLICGGALVVLSALLRMAGFNVWAVQQQIARLRRRMPREMYSRGVPDTPAGRPECMLCEGECACIWRYTLDTGWRRLAAAGEPWSTDEIPAAVHVRTGDGRVVSDAVFSPRDGQLIGGQIEPEPPQAGPEPLTHRIGRRVRVAR